HAQLVEERAVPAVQIRHGEFAGIFRIGLDSRVLADDEVVVVGIEADLRHRVASDGQLGDRTAGELLDGAALGTFEVAKDDAFHTRRSLRNELLAESAAGRGPPITTTVDALPYTRRVGAPRLTAL